MQGDGMDKYSPVRAGCRLSSLQKCEIAIIVVAPEELVPRQCPRLPMNLETIYTPPITNPFAGSALRDL